MKTLREEAGFSMIEVSIASAIAIMGAMYMATSLTKQKQQQASQQIVMTARKVLLEEVTRVQAQPSYFPVIRANLQNSPNLSFVSCYSREGTVVANASGTQGYVAKGIIKDNTATAVQSGVCNPASAAFEAQVYPEAKAGEFTVWVMALINETQKKQRGLVRTVFKQTVFADPVGL